MATNKDYTDHFYDIIAKGCHESAELVVPLILEKFNDVNTVVDIGCGQGWWSRAFLDAGVEIVTSVDGDWVNDPVVDLVRLDITSDPLPSPTFDLAISLEVMEHIPTEASHRVAHWMATHADVVVFSCAIPHQGGAGHISERWHTEWVELFAEYDLHPDDSIRTAIWDDERIEPWYRQNLLVFCTDGKMGGPLNIVHPDIWGWKV